MSHIEKGKEKRLIIVAANPWQQRIYLQIPPAGPKPSWCENVYAALANAIQMHQNHESAVICIMIDTLNREEMEIFSCLSALDGLTTVAFSTLELPQKMKQAQLLGANFTAQLADLQTILTSCQPVNPQELDTSEKTNPDLKITELFPPKEIMSETLSSRSVTPRRTPSQPKTPAVSQPEVPLISEEELKALLG